MTRDPDSLVLAALRHAREAGPTPALEYTPTGDVQTTSSGVSVVRLRQLHGGVPVIDAVRSVRFGTDGSVVAFTGEPVAVHPDTPVLPRVSAREAAYVAARHVADVLLEGSLEISNRRPTVIGEVRAAGAPTFLHKVGFEDPIAASLVVRVGERESRLAWEVRLRLPPPGRSYAVLVLASRAGAPEVFEARALTAHAVEGRVYEIDPGVGATTRPFPPLRSAFPGLGGAAIPKPTWVVGGVTRGNNVSSQDAHGQPVAGTPVGPDVRFAPPDPLGIDQCIVNAFYLCNWLHDFFLLLGFDEAAGNFQKDNDPGVGSGNDALRVVVWDQTIQGIAYFVSQTDGTAPELNLGRLGGRHAALDADVVIHEYTHGVTNRMIGGRNVADPLRHPQSRALGEGFSDYYAVTVLNYLRRRAQLAGEHVYGAWLRNEPLKGLRDFAYGPTFTARYGDLNKAAFKTIHTAGQVWCQALLDVNRALAAGATADVGDERGWQIVFDALRFIDPGPKAPSFLHARDAVRAAYADAVGAGTIPADPAMRKAVDDAFRVRGMGSAAKSPTADFRKIEEDTVHGW